MSNSLCIFGEVLFDHFPDGNSILGGAPFNVAWHLQAFAQNPKFISRVGDDAQGKAIRTAMTDWGMDTQYLQTDPRLTTGKVIVNIIDDEPEYDIIYPCAYDAIERTATTDNCDFLYHGSLALRSTETQEALIQVKNNKPETIFIDVNLRAPWYTISHIQALLPTADWVKLNTDELTLLAPELTNAPTAAADFLKHYQLDGLILTHGSKGAEVITVDGEHHHIQPEQDINVIDTVGAGDAFASIMILGLLNDWPLENTLQRAQLFASHIVANRGATVSDATFYQQFIQQWNLTA